MQGYKAKELRDKPIEELEEMVRNERAALYQTRRDLVFRKVTDTTSVTVRRHNIARMLGIIGEKKREAK